MPFGMSRCGLVELFCGKGQLLNGEKQPDGKGHRRKHAVDSEGQEWAVAVSKLDRRSRRGIGANVQRVFAEVEERNGAEEKHDENADGEQGHHDGDHERQLDAADVEPDKDDVAENPP